MGAAGKVDVGRLWRSLVRSQRQAQQALLQRFVGGQFGHRAAVHDAAVVHHRHRSPSALAIMEVLLDQQDGGLLRLQLAKA
jgi:hypothetical protein